MDPYTRLAKRELYRNPWVTVEAHDIVHPNGVPGVHVLILTGRASGVLVVDGEQVILAEQPRFGARRTMTEIVKGGAEPNEVPLACAQRELREELGLEADTWISMGSTYEIPSIVDEPVQLFAASDVREVASDQEAVEQISLVRIPLADAYAAMCDGRIDDAVTIVALARYRALSASSGS